MKISKKQLAFISALSLLLIIGGALGACKSKKKSQNADAEDNVSTILAPSVVILKNPQHSPSFLNAPTFTVQGVEAGDTVRLFKDARCREDSVIGSGVVEEAQTSLDITVNALPAVGPYAIYANRTDTSGETSACSRRLNLYQLIGCPDESYAPVEGNEELGVEPFCVMKTEAKQGEGDVPVAQHEGTPWVSINAQTAKASCKKINVEHGSCNLLSNAQWLAIARDIEATDANWSGGVVGSGTLNRGHSDNSPSQALAIEYPGDAWDQTGQTSTTWSQKRTHVLSNGSVLWDLAGNVREWVDWATGGYNFTAGPNTCDANFTNLYSFDCAGLNGDEYLPGNPLNIAPNEYIASTYGLGTIYGTSEAKRTAGSGGAALRGGRWNNGADAGIFNLSLDYGIADKTTDIGFRCGCVVTGDPQSYSGLMPPSSVELKSPLNEPSFVNTPTFTVFAVGAGDTVRLFNDPQCRAESLLGSGVVASGQNKLDITLAPLREYGTQKIYANRTNAAGETSICSPALYAYQYITCPNELYAAVPGDPTLGTTDFCVMRMEAKKVNNKAVAQYTGSPWANIQGDAAKTACQQVDIPGARCDLISNPQWMTMARNIEANPVNWSGGEVGSGALSRGHSDANPSNALAITDYNDPLTNTGNEEGNWDQRRTLVLSNGEVIWDLAGNVSEWVDWTTGGETFAIGPYDCAGEWTDLYSFDCAGLQPNDYLPGNPANLPIGEYNSNKGLGQIYGTNPEKHTEDEAGAARRGGLWNYHEKSGIFDMYLNSNFTYKSSSIGFRCVCNMTGE